VHLGIPIAVSIIVPPPRPLPEIDLTLPEAHLGFWSGLLGFFVNPLVGLVTTGVLWIIGHDVGIERRRTRVLAAITKRYGDAQIAAYEHLLAQVQERITSAGAAIGQQARGRLETFVDDAARRIERLGTPRLPGELEILRTCVSSIETLAGEIELISAEISKSMGVSQSGDPP